MAESDLVAWWMAATEWVSKVVATAAIVLGAMWRWLTHMITRKVKEEIELAMRVVTDATSKAIDALRHEMHDNEKRNEERLERLADRITDRIDGLITKRGDRS
jgi:N12 class adenine-specific DNA methylase